MSTLIAVVLGIATIALAVGYVAIVSGSLIFGGCCVNKTLVDVFTYGFWAYVGVIAVGGALRWLISKP